MFIDAVPPEHAAEGDRAHVTDWSGQRRQL
jgi:hypothetical protein